jgi:hypothetical protein
MSRREDAVIGEAQCGSDRADPADSIVGKVHSVECSLLASRPRRQAVRNPDRRETYASAFDRKSAVVRKIEHVGDLVPCSSASLVESRSRIRMLPCLSGWKRCFQ